MYGKLVRDTWVKWAKKQENPKPHHLIPWKKLDAKNKEVDELIGEAVATTAIVHFCKKLAKRMEDGMWSIENVVRVVEVEKDGKVYGRIEDDGNWYRKQDDEFIIQWTGYCEDDFHGVLLIPVSGDIYIKVSYSC
jgi:hypothetical protein